MVAYKGKPLYLFIKDAKAGDMTGDGVGDVWHTAME
jgi:predicted lipoprotein with Yx(FWY)xxD motif